VAKQDRTSDDRHTAALVSGFVLGGLAGAAIALWKAPRSGAQLRAKIVEQVEDVLFKVTGMDEWQPREPISVGPTRSTAADAATEPVPTMSSAGSTASSSGDSGEAATLPPTFRGEPLVEGAKGQESRGGDET